MLLAFQVDTLKLAIGYITFLSDMVATDPLLQQNVLNSSLNSTGINSILVKSSQGGKYFD